MNELNLKSLRARKARWARLISPSLSRLLVAAALILAAAALVLWAENQGGRPAYLSSAVSLLLFMVLMWHKLDLSDTPPDKSAATLDGRLEAGLLGAIGKPGLTPSGAWSAAAGLWQGNFLDNHLLIDRRAVAQVSSQQAGDMPAIWEKSRSLADKVGADEIDAAALAAALLTVPEASKKYLSAMNLSPEDVAEAYEWQLRLGRFFKLPKPYFGGIGRDWASGFTLTLDRFGENISRSVESGRAGHYHTLAHADILDSVVHNLTQGSGGVALVGEAGTGKTALAYALAQRLLEGRDENLKYYQIVSLNASRILSAAADQLEDIILSLFGEAVHAGNIIIFLDEARLFFGKGAGAFDMGQILMPLLQNHSVKIIAAFTPHDFQTLRAGNETLATDMAVINVPEPPPETVMKILEDTALTLEARENIMISYQAVREAYRLGDQYFQDQAYPGKSIRILEQAVPYCQQGVMDTGSVQSAVEKTKGVKVAKAEGPETDVLMHLEDIIHKRMINQARAVKAVASALRRGRSGVANPRRPIGSFLFMGPTGVGKTELARSLAAAYFGDERRMIRLDMTEYQQPEDESRLLDAGTGASQSLMMSIREQPFSVVLLDEVEKAHPSVLNLLLQMLDEGQLTDRDGKPASFKNAIIICTSNAGSAEISQRAGAGESLESFERPLIEKLISAGTFKPELVNRFDEVVLFRPLKEDELVQVAELMVGELNKNLSKQNIKLGLTKEALQVVVQKGNDPEFGARPMRRTIQKMVEDTVAARILSGQVKPGSSVTLDAGDLGQMDS